MDTLSIPDISHFSGTSNLAELGDVCNYQKSSQIIKFAGVAPYHYESSQYMAQHTAITRKALNIYGKPCIKLFYLLSTITKSFVLITTRNYLNVKDTDVIKVIAYENS